MNDENYQTIGYITQTIGQMDTGYEKTFGCLRPLHMVDYLSNTRIRSLAVLGMSMIYND